METGARHHISEKDSVSLCLISVVGRLNSRISFLLSPALARVGVGASQFLEMVITVPTSCGLALDTDSSFIRIVGGIACSLTRLYVGFG